MKRVSISAATCIGLTLASCATSTEVDITRPGKLMAEMIQQRIAQIPYQHKSELLENLLWLAQAGEQAIPDLGKALEHEKPKVRSSAAWVFGRMGDRRAIPELQRRKDEKNPVVRLEISRSLLLLGDYSMVPELIGGMNSEHQHIRYLCYDALHSTTGKTFDYDHRAVDPADREVSLGKWQDWWTKQSEEWRMRGELPGPRSAIGVPATPQGR